MAAVFPSHGYEMAKGNADVDATYGSWMDLSPPNALEVNEANARDDSSAEFVYGYGAGLRETQECGRLPQPTRLRSQVG